MVNKLISKVTLNGTVYDIKDANARARLTSLEGVVRGGIQIKVDTVLPAASADTLGIIHFIPLSAPNGQNKYEEYLTVVGGTEQSPTYSWEKIGTTDIDLSNYAKKSHKHNITTDVRVNQKKYTPTGSVALPAFNCDITKTNETVSKITNAGTLPSMTDGSVSKAADIKASFATGGVQATYQEDSEMLLFSAAPTQQAVIAAGDVTYQKPVLDPGSLPTYSSVAVTNVTAASISSTGNATFTGEEADITPTLVNNPVATSAATE